MRNSGSVSSGFKVLATEYAGEGEDQRPGMHSNPTLHSSFLLPKSGARQNMDAAMSRFQNRFKSREETRGVVKVEVLDTGVGIAKEAVAKLFQPYRQADPSISQYATRN